MRAAATPEPEGGAAGPLQAFARRAEQVLERYDFVSAGLGAMTVTGFCVMRGQVRAGRRGGCPGFEASLRLA